MMDTAIYASPTDDLNAVIDGAGPIAGLFVLLVAIALFFIIRSMNKQMKKIDTNLPPGKADRRQAFDEQLTREAELRGEEQAQDGSSSSTTPPPTQD